MEIIFAGIVIVFMVIFLVMMWTIYRGMKKFLSDNIEEALIVSGDYIGDRVKDLHSTMTGRMNALENENRTLRAEISRRLDALSSIIADANDKSEIGVNSIVKELNYIIPALRDEMKNLLATLSENAEAFQKSTIKNFEAEIIKFTKKINEMCEEIKKSADEQSKTFAGMAGSVHSVMDKGEQDLQSAFTRTHSELRGIITDSMSKINTDYQENMKKMFQAMADNLAAIIKQLSTAGTNAELPGNTAEIKTALTAITDRLDTAAITNRLDTMIERLTPAEKPKKKKKNDTAKEDSDDAA